MKCVNVYENMTDNVNEHNITKVISNLKWCKISNKFIDLSYVIGP